MRSDVVVIAGIGSQDPTQMPVAPDVKMTPPRVGKPAGIELCNLMSSPDPATGLIARAYFLWFKSTEMDIPITRRGKIVSAVRIPPISKILSGNPLISPLNCSNAAKSTMIAAASMITKTALNNMDRGLNS